MAAARSTGSGPHANPTVVLGWARAASALEREREYLSAGKLYMVLLFRALGIKPLPSGVD